MALDCALLDTSFIINGLHTVHAAFERYHSVLTRIKYPVTSSFCRFEYVHRLFRQIRLAMNTLERTHSVGDALNWLLAFSTASRQRAPILAIQYVHDAQLSIATGRGSPLTDPVLEKRWATNWLRLQAVTAAEQFERLAGVDIKDGTGCIYQRLAVRSAKKGKSISWEKILCVPSAIRCRVNQHVLGSTSGEAREASRAIFVNLNKARMNSTATGEHMRMLQSIVSARKSPPVAADSKLCTATGDLIAVMDSVIGKHSITVNPKEWTAFDGAAGLVVHIVDTNPTRGLPPSLTQLAAAPKSA